VIYIGQAEVIDYLKTCDEPVTRKQIADGLECDPIKISHILRDLLRFNEVAYIEHARETASQMVGYILRRRTRFFFIVET